MGFAEYLAEHGPTVKELAEMDTIDREWAAKLAYEHWARCEQPAAYSGTDFLNGWRLCEEVQVWQHMAQDARAAGEVGQTK